MAFVGSAAPFVARVGQLERFRELMGLARSGTATGVIVGGDAGVGKTRTLTEVAQHATATGFQVLLGRCVDLGTGSLPYLPFAEALSQPLRWGERDSAEKSRTAEIIRQVSAERPGLAQIVGAAADVPLRSVGEAGLDRLALFESVAHVLSRIGSEVAPLLLVLEDLHWADSSTRDLVRFLFSRLGPDHLLVLVSYRADDLHRRHPLRPLVGELTRLPRVEQMDLPPLSHTELGQLLAGLNGGPVKPALLRRIVARSAGNPYYAQELLAAGESGRLPEGLTDLLLDRLEQLSAPAQRVVRLASVHSSARIGDALLRAILSGPDAHDRLDPDALESALREAVAQQVLVPEDLDRYRFRHALLQEAIYSDLLPGERVRLHKSIADYLRPLMASPGARGIAAETARHSLAANDMPSALNASLRAAWFAACANAPAEALQHYEQALQLWDVVPPQQRDDDTSRSDVSLRAASVASDAGLLERAVGLAQAATGEAELEGDAVAMARARAALALHTFLADRPEEALEQALRVINDLADDRDPSSARALTWSIVARAHLGAGNPQDALKAVVQALAESQALGMTALQVELLTTQAVAQGMLRRDEDSARSFRLAKAAAELSGDTAGAVRVHYNLALNHLDQGDLTAGIADLLTAIEAADSSGLAASVYGANARQLLILTFWHAGDVERALKVVRPDMGASRLPMALVTHLKLFELPVIATRDPEQVLRADEWLVVVDDAWERPVHLKARAEALNWLGRWEEAAAEARLALGYALADAEHWHLSGIETDTRAISALADGVEEARRAGDLEAERQTLAEIGYFLEDGRTRARLGLPRRGVMGPEGNAWILRLEMEWARAQGIAEAEGWLELARAFEGVSVFEVARAQWRAAQVLVRDGRTHEAEQNIIAARRCAAELGAKPLLGELEKLAQKAGLDLEPLPADAESAREPDLPAGQGAGAASGGESERRGSAVAGPTSSATSGAATTSQAIEASLTPRERQVMTLVAEGLTNRAIGERLHISEKTASVHVSNVLAKLGASGRTEAVAIMSRVGLIP
ncbi:DNA-binding CsgD family transcriptional regulator/tetratricopeptide (TPR) repeat protein [Kineosporia succinea]|uniref:DNA-binding CsgD family transcriptional regulator/tetratricopeptide (TPR) repeat protein n=1 Tax=Kineosporia succinea TaxID=84632 RepID=A0ABT9NW15_9ACTN|nr:DNA-binding CsgD family transcriptional regulator/tetratricopeptide (TPR) repeat protein [Kineosporia succinea]